MRNKAVVITAVVCILLFLAALITVIVQHAEKRGSEIEILLDGEVIYRGPSVESGEPMYIDAVGKTYVNRIRIDERGVSVEESNCPNKECVRMGYLDSKSFPIVCLPNSMIIRYANTQSDSVYDDIDSISR